MDARKIYVICTADQSQKVIMSSAETLGALKRDLDAAHINYANMSFLEGRSKTELKSDESVLPKDVPTRDGGTTNELVFMLTNMKKKIESGASRSQIYLYITENPEVADMIKAHFNGRNYTNISTDDLDAFISSMKSTSTADVKAPCSTCGLRSLVEKLYDEDEISGEAYDALDNFMNGCKGLKPEELSQEEIRELFDFLD